MRLRHRLRVVGTWLTYWRLHHAVLVLVVARLAHELLLRHAAHHGLLHGRRHGHLLHLQRIVEVLSLGHGVHQDTHVILPNALLFEDVLDLEWVAAHGSRLVNQPLLLSLSERVDHLVEVHLVSQRQLGFESLSLLFFGGARDDALLQEELDHLARQLGEHLLGQPKVIILALLVRHKLHNIPRHELFELVRVERLVVGVQLVHPAEVGITDANDDNGQRLSGAANNLVNRRLHIRNNTVRKYQQQVVLLVVLGDLDSFTPIVDV